MPESAKTRHFHYLKSWNYSVDFDTTFGFSRDGFDFTEVFL